MTIKPLDELLGHELLFHSGTDEEFSSALYDGGLDPITYDRLENLYYDKYGIKFMLFEHKGEGYVRLQPNPRKARGHSDIKEGFYNELNVIGLNFNDFIRRGGGNVKAERKGGKTILHFSGSSLDYSEFDSELLAKTLQEHLDKRIEYIIS